MRTGRHRDRAYLFRIEAPLFSLASDHPHSPLAILPGRLVDRKSFRTRSPVDELDALVALGGEFLVPEFHKIDIAAGIIATTGNQDHAGSVAYIRRWSIIPFEIGYAVFLRIEAFPGNFICHCGNLSFLWMRHLSLWPDGLTFYG